MVNNLDVLKTLKESASALSSAAFDADENLRAANALLACALQLCTCAEVSVSAAATEAAEQRECALRTDLLSLQRAQIAEIRALPGRLFCAYGTQ